MFQPLPHITHMINFFLCLQIKEESENGQSLLHLISSCSHGNNLELSSADPDESEMHFWQREEPKQRVSTYKPVLSGHSKEDQKLVFKTVYRLMQVKSIAECSKRAFCNTFDFH